MKIRIDFIIAFLYFAIIGLGLCLRKNVILIIASILSFVFLILYLFKRHITSLTDIESYDAKGIEKCQKFSVKELLGLLNDSNRKNKGGKRK